MNSPTATSPVMDKATYAATPSPRSSPSDNGTVSPDSRVVSPSPKSAAPATRPTTATVATAAVAKTIAPSPLASSSRPRDTGTVSR